MVRPNTSISKGSKRTQLEPNSLSGGFHRAGPAPIPYRATNNDNRILVAFFIVIACVLTYFGISSHRTTSRSIDQSSLVAQKFVADLASQNYTGATSLLSIQGKSINPPESMQSLMDSEETRHGAWKGATQIGLQEKFIYGIETCKLVYRVNFAEHVTRLRILLTHNYEGWQVDSFSFDS